MLLLFLLKYQYSLELERNMVGLGMSKDPQVQS